MSTSRSAVLLLSLVFAAVSVLGDEQGTTVTVITAEDVSRIPADALRIRISVELLSDENLKPISNLKCLTHAVVSGSRHRPNQLALSSLARVRSINHLELLGIWLTEVDALQDLAKMGGLRTLLIRVVGEVPSETCFAPISQLVHLEELVLLNADITDAMVSSLSALKHLKSLDVGANGEISGSGFCAHSGFCALETLVVRDCAIDDAGLLCISQLPSLKHLYLHGNHEVQSLKPLGEMKTLRLISLSNCSGVTASSVRDVFALPDIREVRMDGNLWARAALKALEVGSRVVDLSLDSCELDDDCLRAIGTMRSLTRLSMNDNPRITDDGLKFIAKLAVLEELNLAGTGMGDVGCQIVSRLPKLRCLDICDNSRITRAGVISLMTVRSLRELTISNGAVGDPETIEQLRRALPDCAIEIVPGK